MLNKMTRQRADLSQLGLSVPLQLGHMHSHSSGRDVLVHIRGSENVAFGMLGLVVFRHNLRRSNVRGQLRHVVTQIHCLRALNVEVEHSIVHHSIGQVESRLIQIVSTVIHTIILTSGTILIFTRFDWVGIPLLAAHDDFCTKNMSKQTEIGVKMIKNVG